MNKDLLTEILEDTAELVRRAAHPRKGTVALSPETAALLERISVRPSLDPPTVAESPGDGVASLQALAEEVSACTKCDLCQSRTQTVFSDGSPTADLVFVGEFGRRLRSRLRPLVTPATSRAIPWSAPDHVYNRLPVDACVWVSHTSWAGRCRATPRDACGTSRRGGEMVDALRSGRSVLKDVRVRLSPSAPQIHRIRRYQEAGDHLGPEITRACSSADRAQPCEG